MINKIGKYPLDRTIENQLMLERFHPTVSEDDLIYRENMSR